MTTVLGVNISHHTSICQVTDGQIDFFYDEGRVSRKKEYYIELCSFDFKGLESINRYVDKEKIDHVVYASFGRAGDHMEYYVIDKIQQQLGHPTFEFDPICHHVYHAECAYHLSKLNDALVVVMDGGGSMRYSHAPFYQEIESVYHVNSHSIVEKYKHLTGCRYLHALSKIDYIKEHLFQEYKMFGTDIKLSMELGSGIQFSNLTEELGLDGHNTGGGSAGKTMGLAAYGNLHGTRPEDKARQLQEKTRQDTIILLKKAVSYHECKNVILTGGYSLNCTNNYLYLSEFPDHNFFIDPIGHDGGTAVGAALYYFRKNKLLF